MKIFIMLLGFLSLAQADSTFYYYSKEDRLQVLNEVYQVVKNRYSLWEVKLLNMEIDGDKLFQDAIAFEKSLEEAQGPMAKALSNLKFHTRMKKLIASFKDTHFPARENAPLPNMLNGLDLRLYKDSGEDKVLVAAISKKIFELNKALGKNSAYLKIKNGDQVIAINDVPVMDLVKTLESYVAASSPRFATSRATMHLARRNYLYADKNYSDWTFQNSKGKNYKVRLPWYIDRTNRRDANTYFLGKGFKTLDKAYFSWNDEALKWDIDKDLNYEGYNRFAAPKGIIQEVVWESKGDPELRTGYFIKNGKSYGFIQFFSFTRDMLENNGSKKGIATIFKEFIQELKEKQVPLIVDIRVNFGGNTAIAIENLSSIAKANDSYPSRTVVFKTSQFIESLFNTEAYDPALSEAPTFSDFERTINEFYYALSIGRKYTDVLLQSEPITAHPEVEGYELPVVALVSPWCISACDNQAFLFKGSERVTLIGEPANGTGAGFYGNSSHNTSFIDSLNITRSRIPNYLFGYPKKTDQLVLADPDMKIMLETNSENRPVKPHLEFNYTKDSYMKNGEDWINFAIEVIDSK